MKTQGTLASLHERLVELGYGYLDGCEQHDSRKVGVTMRYGKEGSTVTLIRVKLGREAGWESKTVYHSNGPDTWEVELPEA
jgi:hypothetical protein